MLVRYYWPNHVKQSGKSGKDVSIDSFWVEATLEEAEKAVFPHISEDARFQSTHTAEELIVIAKKIMQPPHPYCFLVARDMSEIEPNDVHYPFHHMWNAYSPFRKIEMHEIDNLDELAAIRIDCGEAK